MDKAIAVLEKALNTIIQFSLDEKEIEDQLKRAAKVFLGASNKTHSDEAHARFSEWFCLEREYRPGWKPFDEFINAGMPGLENNEREIALAMKASRTGIFEVLSWQKDEFLVLRDGTARDTLLLAWPKSSLETPQTGECLIGRIFPQPDSTEDIFLPSPSIVLFQAEGLSKALQEDSLLAQTTGFRPKLGQLELEMLMRGEEVGDKNGESFTSGLDLSDLLERIQLVFDRFGFVGIQAVDLVEQVQNARVFSDVFSDLLDELAFDTDVDLDEVRRLFLQLWESVKGKKKAKKAKAEKNWQDLDSPCHCGSGKSYLECHMGKDLVNRLEEAEDKNDSLSRVFVGLNEALKDKEVQETGWGLTAFEEGLIEARALIDEYTWEKELDIESFESKIFSNYMDFLDNELVTISTPLRPSELVGEPLQAFYLSRLISEEPFGLEVMEKECKSVLFPFGNWLVDEHGYEKCHDGMDRFNKVFHPSISRACKAREELIANALDVKGENREAHVFLVAQEETGFLLKQWKDQEKVARLFSKDTALLLDGDLIIGQPISQKISQKEELYFPGPVIVIPKEAVLLLECIGFKA